MRRILGPRTRSAAEPRGGKRHEASPCMTPKAYSAVRRGDRRQCPRTPRGARSDFYLFKPVYVLIEIKGLVAYPKGKLITCTSLVNGK